MAPEKLIPPGGESVVGSCPVGVLFGVEPWNCPYDQIAHFAAPAGAYNKIPVWFISGCSTGFGKGLAKQAIERGCRTVVTAPDLA